MIYKSNAAGTWDLVGSSPPGVIVKTDGSHWVTAVDANDALTIAPFILS
jgi:streptogramin lyase